MTTLLGEREVCLVGGVVGGRRVDGGVCFDERSRHWRAVTGEASGKGLVYGVMRGCRNCATCSFLDHNERGVIFECTSQVDRGNVGGNWLPGKIRWEYYHRLVSGIR